MNLQFLKLQLPETAALKSALKNAPSERLHGLTLCISDNMSVPLKRDSSVAVPHLSPHDARRRPIVEEHRRNGVAECM